MTTKRELRADKITVLQGLAANPHFTALNYDKRFEIYCEVMTLVVDVHEDHQDDTETTAAPVVRAAFDWDDTIANVIETGLPFRRDYPNKNTAQTTTSKLKKKYDLGKVRISAVESETGGGTIIVARRVGT